MQYTYTSISALQRTYSQLSQSSKIKDGGAGWRAKHDISSLRFPPDSPWFLSPQRHRAWLHNLLDNTACHRPGLLACHGDDQPCVAATWRPVWQLTSITVTLSHSSFSRAPSQAWFIAWKMVNAGATLQNLGHTFFLVYFSGNFILYWHMPKWMAFLILSHLTNRVLL